jgi:hypothetical protein
MINLGRVLAALGRPRQQSVRAGQVDVRPGVAAPAGCHDRPLPLPTPAETTPWAPGVAPSVSPDEVDAVADELNGGPEDGVARQPMGLRASRIHR